jgi:hypothetical protein
MLQAPAICALMLTQIVKNALQQQHVHHVVQDMREQHARHAVQDIICQIVILLHASLALQQCLIALPVPIVLIVQPATQLLIIHLYVNVLQVITNQISTLIHVHNVLHQYLIVASALLMHLVILAMMAM